MADGHGAAGRRKLREGAVDRSGARLPAVRRASGTQLADGRPLGDRQGARKAEPDGSVLSRAPRPSTQFRPGSIPPTSGRRCSSTVAAVDDGRAWETSILDAVDRRYVKLAQRLGAADRQRLEAHLERIRELEKRRLGGGGTRACAPPVLVDTSDYNPRAGSIRPTTAASKISHRRRHPQGRQADDGHDGDGVRLRHHRRSALAVGDSEAEYTFPWLNLPETPQVLRERRRLSTGRARDHLHLVFVAARVSPAAARRASTWAATRCSTRRSSSSGPSCASGDPHKKNMPFLLARRRPAYRTLGPVRRATHPTTTCWSRCSTCSAIARTTFGDPRCITGPLPNLV